MSPFAIIIPILSFFLQSYPRLFNKLFGVDVWTRLLETAHIRKNNHHIPQKKLSEQFIIEGYFDYPPVFPWILSFIPPKTLLNFQGFIAPFFDSIQVLLIFSVTHYFTGNIGLSLLAQLMYALTPMVALENSYLTPRSLGYLNFSILTLSLLNFYYIHNPIYLYLGIIFGTFIFLTHRFATQSYLFITIFFTYYLNTALFVQVFLVGFVLAVSLTKGYYLRVLKGHLYNIYFWICNLDYRFAHQVRGVLKKETKTDWVGQIYRFLSVFSPVAVFGLNPWAISGFLIVGAGYFNLINISPLFLTYAAWILFFYCFGVLVLKIKFLMPIGEGQRYLEMATVPSSLLSAYLVFESLSTRFSTVVVLGTTVLLIVNLVIILSVQIKGVIQDKNRSVTSELQQIFSYINKQKKPLRIVSVPHQNTTLLVYHTNAQVFVNADNPGLMKIQEVYPILTISLKELAKKYSLTHALVRTSFATLKELGLKEKDVVYQSGDNLIVKLG
ncbi:MAG: hypothetical protein ABI425_00870 [Patescibacteria group bacterium]